MAENKAYKQISPWSLADLFPSAESEAYQQALNKLQEMVEQFEQRRDDLTEDMDEKTFLEIIREMEQITLLMHRVGGFIELWFTEDTQNQKAQSCSQRSNSSQRNFQPRPVLQHLVEIAR